MSVNLEFGLHYNDSETWRVELRLEQQHSESDPGPWFQTVPRVDLDQLRANAQDAVQYGQLLTDSLFSDALIREKFLQASAVTASDDTPLRIRLFIGPSLPELHDVRWETLRHPVSTDPLLLSERLLFSRYLGSSDWRPIRVRPRAQLSAVVAVASPSDVDSYRGPGRPLPDIDQAAQVAGIRSATVGLRLAELAKPDPPTLDEIAARVRDGVDVLILICHGYLHNGEPVLLLENKNGTAARVSGGALVERFRQLPTLPRLIVLVSCQTAGSGDDTFESGNSALAALGPRLAEAGIPAVLAMQGDVSMKTIADFLPAFFGALQHDGEIDRAVAVARGVVRNERDWMMPVLFLRLKSGRIWYSPGFAGSQPFEQWPSVFSEVVQGKCTPILGPGMTDGLIGSRQEVAWRWSSRYRFPMRPADREDLPQVAQYLAVSLGQRFPRLELGQYLRRDLIDRYRLDNVGLEDSLDTLLTEVVAHRANGKSSEPHDVLAALECPIYITTQPTRLLDEALERRGKKPRAELFPWKELLDDDDEDAWPVSVFRLDPEYVPDKDHPLVYHLFGRLDLPESLVITEDDYFDFLIGVTRHAIPKKVTRAFTDSALLFVGFRMDEWDFRVLFRGLMNGPGAHRRDKYPQVLAQIDPEESSTLDPDRARRYLERYVPEVNIYWGTVEDFTDELGERWERWKRERR